MVLYALGDGGAPSWIGLRHAQHTRKVVVLMVPGLERGMFDGQQLVGTDVVGIALKNKNEHANLTDLPNQSPNISEDYHIESKQAERAQQSPIKLDIGSIPQSLQIFSEIFQCMWNVKTPGDKRYQKVHSPIQAMLFSPLPQTKTRHFAEVEKPISRRGIASSMKTAIVHFIHSSDELREAGYPLRPTVSGRETAAVLHFKGCDKQLNQGNSEGWVDSGLSMSEMCSLPSGEVEKNDVTLGCTVLALDCEMVLTVDERQSLARISIVDWDGRTVVDELVKPNLPIKNYFTQFSGITESMLRPVVTTITDIQTKLLNVITPQTILLGHSLEADLTALKITHPFIVDTSLIYPHPRGLPLRLSLKHLTKRFLHRDIQQGGTQGHDSIEDAVAVLDLVKLKCEKGPAFGTFEATGESIFRRLSRQKRKEKNGVDRNITTAMVDYGQPQRGYGKEATIQIGCQDDDEIVKGITRTVMGVNEDLIPSEGVDFVWGRLRELEMFQGWCDNNFGSKGFEAVEGIPLKRQVPPAPKAGKTDENHEPGSKKLECSSPSLDPISHMMQNTMPDSQSGEAFNAMEIAVPKPSPSGLEARIRSTASRIRAIYESLPSCTLFVVYTGTGDPRQLCRLQAMQTRFRKEFKLKKWDELSVKWTDEDHQALKKAVETARDGIGFMCMK